MSHRLYGKYGDVAITAVELARETGNPVEAWKKALIEVGAADKVCPRSAFFGLCSEGFVKGITPGKYTRSKKNKGIPTPS